MAARVILPAFLLACAALLQAQTSGLNITISSKPSPPGLGQNLFEVTVTDAAKRPVTDVEVRLTLLMPADPKTRHPEMKTEGLLNAAGGGKYSGIAMVTMAGRWDVRATVLRKGKPIGDKTVQMTAVLSRRAAEKPSSRPAGKPKSPPKSAPAPE